MFALVHLKATTTRQELIKKQYRRSSMSHLNAILSKEGENLISWLKYKSVKTLPLISTSHHHPLQGTRNSKLFSLCFHFRFWFFLLLVFFFVFLRFIIVFRVYNKCVSSERVPNKRKISKYSLLCNANKSRVTLFNSFFREPLECHLEPVFGFFFHG